MSPKRLEPPHSTAGLTNPRERLEPVKVEAIDGPGAGAHADLNVGLMIVGSQPPCELVISDPAVSRRHVSLELLPGKVRVRDLGSRNGTIYLGAKISEALVPVGGSVTLGKTALRFSPARRRVAASEKEELQGLLGRSVPMRQLFAAIEAVAPLETTVLVTGETGVGKDSVARAVHALSARAAGPFSVFDCAAASEQLLESNLFGHVRGAFTGADRDRSGAVAEAEGGTLLLDGVNELPMALQPKLLRLIEAREYRPVGSDSPRAASLRVIASTDRDLEAEVKASRFRADLYFRLAVLELRVPALRERTEDIALLAAHFARQQSGVEVRFEPSTLAALQCDAWPGNVRELRNAVQRVLALGGDFDAAPDARPDAPRSYREARSVLLHKFEHDYLYALLEKCGGNISAAAREAGLSRMTLYRLLERHRLKLAEDEEDR